MIITDRDLHFLLSSLSFLLTLRRQFLHVLFDRTIEHRRTAYRDSRCEFAALNSATVLNKSYLNS